MTSAGPTVKAFASMLHAREPISFNARVRGAISLFRFKRPFARSFALFNKKVRLSL